MGKQIKRTLALALSFSVIASASVTALPDSATRVQAEQAVVQDQETFDNVPASEIAAALSPAWNLGNTMEANMAKKSDGVWHNYPKETAWSNPVVTKEIFEAVRDAGFKSVRIPTSYLAYIGDAQSGYQIDESWMSRVEEVVRMALDTGLYVNINIHGDGYYTIQDSWLLCGEDAEKQKEIQAKYKAVWKQIAERFADCDEHLIFESMNEEFDGVNGFPNASTHQAYQNIVDYNQIFVDTIRETGGNNAKRWLMVCGWNTNIDATVSPTLGFKLPTDTHRDASIPAEETRVMVSCHYYSPWQFCGEETDQYTQWGKYAIDSSKKYRDGNEDYLASQFQALQETFTSKGVPVYIGEYGAIDKTAGDPVNDAYRSYFMKTLCQTCKDTGCIPVYWDQGYNGNHAFYLFDRNTYAITKPALVNAIMDVYDGDDSPKTAEDVTNLYLTEVSKTFYLGKENASCQLKAVLDPIEIEDTITWSTDNDAVATVSTDGIVTAVGAGECNIIATSSNGTKGICAVKVFRSASSVKLSESELSLDVDKRETKRLTVSYTPEDAEDTVTWSSSRTSVAKVDSSGLVTSVSKGNCVITATLGNGLTAECAVTVYSASHPDPTAEPGKDETPAPPAETPQPSATPPAATQQPIVTPPADTAAVGDTVKISGQKYKITDTKKTAVAYQSPKNKKVTSATVPATVKIDGKTYKVTAIAANAFKNDKKLKSVKIGANVQTIGRNAFFGAVKLKKVTIQSKNLKQIGGKAFYKVAKKCKISVPKTKYKKYKKLFKGKYQKKTVAILKK